MYIFNNIGKYEVLWALSTQTYIHSIVYSEINFMDLYWIQKIDLWIEPFFSYFPKCISYKKAISYMVISKRNEGNSYSASGRKYNILCFRDLE